MQGYRCTDAGEGYEYDLLTHSHQGVLRVQVKALSLTGINPLRRTSHRFGGETVSKNYGADAFDLLMLISRDSSEYYLIPSSELSKDDRLKSNVKHSHFLPFQFH